MEFVTLSHKINGDIEAAIRALQEAKQAKNYDTRIRAMLRISASLEDTAQYWQEKLADYLNDALENAD